MGMAFWGKAPGDDLLLHGKATLPSARLRFTSEFGMGSGGSTTLWSPGRRLEGSQRCRFLAGNTRTLSRSVLRIRWDVARLWTSDVVETCREPSLYRETSVFVLLHTTEVFEDT